MKKNEVTTKSVLPPPIHNYEPAGESKNAKRINKIIVGALIAIAVSLGIMFYWATASEKPITLNKEPFPTRTIRDHPTAGGVVFLTTDYCKNTNAVGDLRISFVSETREVFLPLSRELSKKGCHNQELVVLIPNDIQPGTYKVKLSITYDLNPLKQNINQVFMSHTIIIDPVSSTNSLPSGTNMQGN